MSTSLLPVAALPQIMPEFPGAVMLLDISSIRRNGGTQFRKNLPDEAIREYAQQMEAGETFPPVAVWYDGSDYWLSDGFQRVAAAEQIGWSTILSEIRRGSLNDAKWSSYASNSRHGVRRSTEDIVNAIQNAMAHSNAQMLSHNQIAKHLNVPEATFRRLLKTLPAPEPKGATCIVTRSGKCYEMNTSGIGSNSRKCPVQTKAKSLKELEGRLASLREQATPPVQTLLNVFANWAFGAVNDQECMMALSRLHKRWTGLQL